MMKSPKTVSPHSMLNLKNPARLDTTKSLVKIYHKQGSLELDQNK